MGRKDVGEFLRRTVQDQYPESRQRSADFCLSGMGSCRRWHQGSRYCDAGHWHDDGGCQRSPEPGTTSMNTFHTKELYAFLRKVSPNPCRTWSAFSVALFWSNPDVTQEEWLGFLLDSKTADGILEDMLRCVSIGSILRFFPLELYYSAWPNICLYCPENVLRERALYDVCWSVLVTGTFFVPPLMSWFDLMEKQKTRIAYVSRFQSRRLTCLPGDAQLITLGFLQSFGNRVLTGDAHRLLRIRWPQARVTYSVKGIPGKRFSEARDIRI